MGQPRIDLLLIFWFQLIWAQAELLQCLQLCVEKRSTFAIEGRMIGVYCLTFNDERLLTHIHSISVRMKTHFV